MAGARSITMAAISPISMTKMDFGFKLRCFAVAMHASIGFPTTDDGSTAGCSNGNVKRVRTAAASGHIISIVSAMSWNCDAME